MHRYPLQAATASAITVKVLPLSSSYATATLDTSAISHLHYIRMESNLKADLGDSVQSNDSIQEREPVFYL